MSKHSKNISTLLFFVLSIGLSYSLIPKPEGRVGLDGTYIIQYEDSKNILNLDSSNLSLYNPFYSLKFSLNGGKTFSETKEKIYLEDVENPSLLQCVTGTKWKAPNYKLPKILSLRYFAENSERGKQTDEVVYTDLRNFESSLPIVSLNCDEAYFFDPFYGVMLSGENGSKNSSFYTKWFDRPGNYTLRGKEHSTKSNFQYFENKELTFEREVNIRISGNATRRFPQKSLRIQVENNQTFNFFGDKETEWNSIVLRNSGNDNSKTMFADLIMHEFAKEANLLTQKGKPCHLFINGNYWGIYNLRERINQKFIAEKEKVKVKTVTILENGNGELKAGSEKVQKEFIKKVEHWNSLNRIDKTVYAEIKEYISIKSFIDYMFFETFYGNVDWPSNNIIWYKAEDKKWKWLLNDLDLSLAFTSDLNLSTDHFKRIKNSNTLCSNLFFQLLTHEKFKSKFIEQCHKIMENTFNDHNIETTFEKFINKYEPEIELQIKRWRITSSKEIWLGNIQENIYFLKKRKAFYKEHLGKL
ncbi:MAG: CotH kinase family protein [Crocinitomicaceae bacterium]|nr:CotH kinase family protein [Crocinitomicaceae bacterium]